MDYNKVDAPLNEALTESSASRRDQFLVFIHTNRELNQDEAADLQNLGVTGDARKRIYTAKLSHTDVDQLSDKPWIRSIRLSQKLRVADNGLND